VTKRLAQVSGEGFRRKQGGTRLCSPAFDLEAGRYMLRLEPGEPSEDTIVLRLVGDEEDIFYVHCDWNRMFADRGSMVFELRTDCRVELRIDGFAPEHVDARSLGAMELLSVRWAPPAS
jgi:hypothetical protein